MNKFQQELLDTITVLLNTAKANDYSLSTPVHPYWIKLESLISQTGNINLFYCEYCGCGKCVEAKELAGKENE